MGVWQKQNVYKRVFTSSSSFLSRDHLLLGHIKVFFDFRFMNYTNTSYVVYVLCMYVSTYVVKKDRTGKLMGATFLKSYISRDFRGNANYLDD